MRQTWVKSAFFVWVCSVASASAAVNPEHVFVADTQKTSSYIKDGLVVGGDRAITEVVVRDIRHSMNKGYERIVVDLEGNRSGEPVAIQRPPYFQVEVSPEMKRLVFTVWGKPKLALQSDKVIKGFRRSRLIEKVEMMPILEKDRWTFVLTLKSGVPVEIFELKNPLRVILDIKSASQ